MIRFKTAKKKTKIIWDVICNKCGKTCRLGEAEPVNFGGLRGVAHGQFGSEHLKDCHEYRFDLCEQCLRETFDTFKIPVLEVDIGPWGGRK
jgi:uncharacterized cysteine cluster protein YcgN (CxxCxxCC family)